MDKVFLIILFLGTLCLSVGTLQLPPETPWYLTEEGESIRPRYIMPDYRLPKEFVPSQYLLFIRPILFGDENPGEEAWTAPGNVTITAEAITNTNIITLHAHPQHLDVHEDSLRVTDVEDSLTWDVVSVTYNATNEIMVLHLDRPILNGTTVKISAEFTARIGGAERLLGMYWRTYWVPPAYTEQKYLILTKTEAVGTRMMFPCFDEPQLKATFEVFIGRKNTYHSLSNAEIYETVPHESMADWYWDIYNYSPVMSTYLLELIVSDFTNVLADADIWPKESKVWAVPHYITDNAGIYGANETARVLDFFENLYNLSYPLAKMDSIAIPNFSSGAMEQWGLITYREDYLLHFAGETTEAERRRVTLIIAHEVAHQWFGNIVTMKWWDDLWLNEGFATYVEKLGLHDLQPGFEGDNLMIAVDKVNAMVRDNQPGARAVHYDGDIPSQIVYSKGGCLIRMMNAIITIPVFQAAINEYLGKFQFNNAEQDDLFTILTTHAHRNQTLSPGITVKEIMDTWMKQSGFPLIRVLRGSQSRIIVSQERYGDVEPYIDPDLDPNHLWYVPLAYVTKANPESSSHASQQPKFWLPKASTITTHDVNASEWILFNTDNRYYYRVMYDSPLYVMLLDQLNQDSKVFSDANRAQLFDDYLKMTFDDYVSVETAMELTRYLGSEDKLAVWTVVNSNLAQSLTHMMNHPNHSAVFREYFLPRVESALSLIGDEQNPGDAGANVILRSILYDWLCAINSDKCEEYATKLYTTWQNDIDNNPVFPDLRRVLYCAMLRTQGPGTLQFFLDKYDSTHEKEPVQKTLWLNALPCTFNDQPVTHLLNVARNETVMTKAHGHEVMRRLMTNVQARDFTFAHLRDNFPSFLGHFGPTMMESTFTELSRNIVEEGKLNDLVTFVESHAASWNDAAAFVRTIRSNVQITRNWFEKYGNAMAGWMSRNNSN